MMRGTFLRCLTWRGALAFALLFAAPGWISAQTISAGTISLNRASSAGVSAAIIPAASEVGRTVNVWIGAVLGGRVFVRDGASNWVDYRGGALPVALRNVALAPSLPVAVTNVDVSVLPGLEFYVGYGSTEAELFAGGHLVKVHTVPAAAESGTTTTTGTTTPTTTTATTLSFDAIAKDTAGNCGALETQTLSGDLTPTGQAGKYSVTLFGVTKTIDVPGTTQATLVYSDSGGTVTQPVQITVSTQANTFNGSYSWVWKSDDGSLSCNAQGTITGTLRSSSSGSTQATPATFGRYAQLGATHTFLASNLGSRNFVINPGVVYIYSPIDGSQLMRTDEYCNYRVNGDGSVSEFDSAGAEKARYSWEDTTVAPSWATSGLRLYAGSTQADDTGVFVDVIYQPVSSDNVTMVLKRGSSLCVAKTDRHSFDFMRISSAVAEVSYAPYAGTYDSSAGSANDLGSRYGLNNIKSCSVTISGGWANVNITTSSQTISKSFASFDSRIYQPPLKLSDLFTTQTAITSNPQFPANKYRMFDTNLFLFPSNDPWILEMGDPANFAAGRTIFLHYGVSNYDATPGYFDKEGTIGCTVAKRG